MPASKNHAPAKLFDHVYPANVDVELGKINNIENDYLYGRVLQVDSNDPERMVWSFADDDISPRSDNKTFPTTLSNFYVASSNAADTGIVITCSTINTAGERVFITATTDASDGRTPVLFGTGVDINFVFMSGADQVNLGELYFTNSGAFTLGRPDTPSSVLAHVPIGYGCSPQALVVVPEGKTIIIEEIVLTLARASGIAGSAVVHLNVKRDGGSFVVAREWHLQSGTIVLPCNNLTFAGGSIIHFTMFDVSDMNTNIGIEAHFKYVDN